MTLNVKSYLIKFFSLAIITFMSCNNIFASDQNQKTILIVDDNRGLRMTLDMVLRKAGYTVIQAEGKGDALKKVGEHHDIKLIITDGQMETREAGIELIKALKASENKNIPILLYSAESPEYKAEAMDAGALFALQKPFVKDELLREVQQYVK